MFVGNNVLAASGWVFADARRYGGFGRCEPWRIRQIDE